jgi:hypothetical protein
VVGPQGQGPSLHVNSETDITQAASLGEQLNELESLSAAEELGFRFATQ